MQGYGSRFCTVTQGVSTRHTLASAEAPEVRSSSDQSSNGAGRRKCSACTAPAAEGGPCSGTSSAQSPPVVARTCNEACGGRPGGRTMHGT